MQAGFPFQCIFTRFKDGPLRRNQVNQLVFGLNVNRQAMGVCNYGRTDIAVALLICPYDSLKFIISRCKELCFAPVCIYVYMLQSDAQATRGC